MEQGCFLHPDKFRAECGGCVSKLMNHASDLRAQLAEKDTEIDRLTADQASTMIHFGVDPSDWCGDAKSAAEALLNPELPQGDPPEPGTVAECLFDLRAQLGATGNALSEATDALVRERNNSVYRSNVQVYNKQKEQEISDLRAQLAEAEQQMGHLGLDLAKAERQRDALVVWVRNRGHNLDCLRFRNFGGKCTCGWTEVLAAAKEGE